MHKFATAFLAAAAALSAPAFAQDAGSITLRVDAGSAMSSNGGEYASANTGTPLSAGEKLMVNPGSSVTLNYGTGCSVTYNQPGVYTVPGKCFEPINDGHLTPDHRLLNAGIIIGAAVLGGGLIQSKGTTPGCPISGGARFC